MDNFAITVFLTDVIYQDPDICVGLFTVWTWSVKISKDLFSDTLKRS